MEPPHILTALAVLLVPLVAGPTARADTLVIGASETVHLYPGELTLRAKIDTGARTSSLHVPTYRRYREGVRNWVEFNYVGRNGRSAKIRRPIVRIARVKDLTGPSQQRPVIMLGICLGTIFKETEVTLFDRTGFNFRMLLGRKFLDKDFIVDVSRRQKHEPICEGTLEE